MTPFQLRTRASRDIKSAFVLLGADDPDNASKLAGEAAELALKARYCTRNGIANFPETLKEFKDAGLRNLMDHDLTKLLKLAQGVEIQKYTGIDWDRIGVWDVVQRYDPVGSIGSEQATERIEHSNVFIGLLRLHELLERLSSVRAELEQTIGTPFDFFVAELEPRSEHLRLLVGGPAIWRIGQDEFMKRLSASVSAHADTDVAAELDKYLLISPWNGVFRAYSTLQWQHRGFSLVMNNYVYGVTVHMAYLIPAAGFHTSNFDSPSKMVGNVFM